MRRALAVCSFAAACSSSNPPLKVAAEADSPIVMFEGTCDASGAVPIDAHQFAVADDEDNILRVYHAVRGGEPLASTDVGRSITEGNSSEADLEAATELGDRALWLASHGRSKKGKRKPDRLVLFATSRPSSGGKMEVLGSVYRTLLDDLISDPRLARFSFESAAEKPPQLQDGLNIEGMTAAPEGFVWLGFRTPLDNGRAILLELSNPRDLQEGGRAKLGKAVTLDLEGRGIRALSYWHGRYLILAGNDENMPTKLFTWRGGPADWTSSVAERVPLDLTAFNPEAFFTPETNDRIMLLSDDGERLVDGVPCKKLKDPSKKSFRGVWISLPGDPPQPRN